MLQRSLDNENQNHAESTAFGWRQQKRLIVWGAASLVLVLAIAFLLGSWFGSRKNAKSGDAGGRKVLYYVDPMNPAHTSPEPGLAPCGMKMEPVYAEEEGSRPPGSMPPGTVKINAAKQQLIGVKVEKVEKAPWTYRLRTLGKVAVDDTRIYRINAFTEGWILKTFDNSVGSLVKKDERLASFYTREFVTAEQTYFHALVTMDRLKKGDQVLPDQLALTTWQVRAAEENLENLGMSKAQIKELGRTRQMVQDIYITAPATSFILGRKVSPGQKFERGAELYKLADLSRVWIMADLFEYEAPHIQPGTQVRVNLTDQSRAFVATVTEILPLFDPVTRTLKVRLEADNPGYFLKPEMFVDLEFPIPLPATISVPVSAVLDSGLKQTVFVEQGNGFFEPRKVTTGWRYGERVQILSGLKPGERIVVSGNFLIDSESRMKLAAAGIFGEVNHDPVCGVLVDQHKSAAAGWKSDYHGKSYFFCSEGCKEKFASVPERYLSKSAQNQGGAPAEKASQASPGPVKDPVCGQEVDAAKAGREGLKADYQGKTYYFCSKPCLTRFNNGPTFYLSMPMVEVKGQNQPGPRPAPPALPKENAPPSSAPNPAPNPAGVHAGVKAGSGPPAPPAHHHKAQGEVTAAGPKDPVCGLVLDKTKAQAAGLMSAHGNRVYFFCSPACKDNFDENPVTYAGKPQAPEPEELTPEEIERKMRPGAAKDPVCGLVVDKTATEAEKRTSKYQGQTYYFCGDECKEEFESAPQKYLQKQTTGEAAGPLVAPPPALPGHGRRQN